jgi:hypothetical protein
MEVEGVKQVKVDLDKKVAEIQFIPVKVDLARLETAIVNAGYDANDKKRNSESYEKLPECCKECEEHEIPTRVGISCRR